jgi:hypothetical protein
MSAQCDGFAHISRFFCVDRARGSCKRETASGLPRVGNRTRQKRRQCGEVGAHVSPSLIHPATMAEIISFFHRSQISNSQKLQSSLQSQTLHPTSPESQAKIPLYPWWHRILDLQRVETTPNSNPKPQATSGVSGFARLNSTSPILPTACSSQDVQRTSVEGSCIGARSSVFSTSLGGR